jgi:hypothetical protein
MAEHDHKKEGAGWQEHEALGRELDAALAKYASIEPRAGLEERVLANLRVERQKVSQGGFWRSAVLVMAMIAVAWVLTWKLGRPRQDSAAPRPSTTLGSQPVPHRVSTGEEKAVHSHRPIVVQRASARRAHPPVIIAAEPKLEQFPSPQPLSEQEKMLASYVANYPEHATLLARARAEALRRDAAKESDEGQGGREDSQQQVR